MSQGCSEVIPVIIRDELIMRMMGSAPLALRMLERFLAGAQADCDLIESVVSTIGNLLAAAISGRLIDTQAITSSKGGWVANGSFWDALHGDQTIGELLKREVKSCHHRHSKRYPWQQLLANRSTWPCFHT